MAEINLLDRLPQTKRDVNKRAEERSPQDREIARRYDREFFDGDRRYGYGGYRYDGRWRPVAERFVEYYGLKSDARILDIGCAKGFLMYDFTQVLPGCTVRGLDVSTYARENAYEGSGELIDIGSAEELPYPDRSFDLVISINTIHNLPRERLRRSLQEIERVGNGKAFISVDAWRTDEERERLEKWILTAETWMSVPDWVSFFGEAGYQGDYWWFIP